MPKQTRNKNLMKNARKSNKKTGGRKQGTDSGWNPANESENATKHGSKRPLARSLGKSRGTKTHADHTNPRGGGANPRGGGANPRGYGTNRNGFGASHSKENWIWGHHAVKAALENPRRTHHKLYITPKMGERLGNSLKTYKGEMFKVHPSEIDGILPDGAVHQGAALKSAPLPEHDLEAVADPAQGLIIVLDQITDPHNVGAVFRLAAAFGAKAIIMQTRNAPPLAGAVTKVAVGTVETVPHVLVTNIANTLLELQKMNWRVTGLAGEASITLEQAFQRAEAEVIVMGAEGPGLRKRVRDCCDQLAKIPMPGSEKWGAESLNVSTAAGIALYEAARGLG